MSQPGLARLVCTRRTIDDRYESRVTHLSIVRRDECFYTLRQPLVTVTTRTDGKL